MGLRAPHGRSLFYEKSDQKRATRFLGRPATRRGYAAAGTLRVVLAASRPSSSLGVGQIPRSARTCPTGSFGLRRCGNATRCPHASVRYAHPSFIAAFSRRRAQSPAVAVTGHNTPSWLSHGAPFMPPRKRAQGFDVALYRRGAGRLSAAEVDFAASPAPRCHAPPAKKTRMLSSVLAVQRLEKPPV